MRESPPRHRISPMLVRSFDLLPGEYVIRSQWAIYMWLPFPIPTGYNSRLYLTNKRLIFPPLKGPLALFRLHIPPLAGPLFALEHETIARVGPAKLTLKLAPWTSSWYAESSGKRHWFRTRRWPRRGRSDWTEDIAAAAGVSIGEPLALYT